jgi:TonB-dependent receptor
MSDPANYYWAFTQDGQSMSHAKEWAWREDVDFDLGSGFFKALGAGVRVAERRAETDLTEPGNGYNWQAVSQTWMLGWNLPTLAYLNQFQAPTRVTSFSNFLNGKASLPSTVVFPGVSLPNVAGMALLQGFRTALCQQLNPTCNYAWTPGSFDQAPGSPPSGGLNTQDEHTYAAYFNIKFGSEIGGLPYDGNVGVRVVRTLETANGYLNLSAFTLPDQLPGGHSANEYVVFPGFANPLSAKNGYTDVLPSLNLRLHWGEHLQSRLALSEGMARPDFSQLQAFTTLGSTIDNVTGIQKYTGSANGNPQLKPTKAFQLDGTLEWYFAQSGSLTADVFYKHLTDIVINRVFNVAATDSDGGSHEFTTTGPINGASGKVKGVEVAYQQYYDFLPKMLRGFGTQLNFTYLDSHQTVDNPGTGTYCEAFDTFSVNLNGCDTDGRAFGNLPLQGLSKYAYNAALLYDRGPVSARLAYSWRSKYLMGTNVYPLKNTNGLNTDPNSPDYGKQNVTWGLPLYADSYGELDASVFYNITPHLTLGVQGLNLTDTLYKELAQQHIGMTTFAWYGSGRTYSVQLRATL